MPTAWLRYAPKFLRQRLATAESRKVVANIGWLTVDRLIRMVLGLGVGVWVARYLGPDLYGAYSYAIAIVAMFSAFSTLGIESILVRDLVKEPEQSNRLLGTAFILQLTGAIAAFLGAFYIVKSLQPENALIHGLVAITATGTFFQAFNVIDYWYQSKVASKFTVVAKNTAFITISIVKILCISLQASIIAFALAGVAELAIGALGILITYLSFSKQSLLKWRFHSRTAKFLVTQSWPLLLTDLVILIYMRIDQIMLGNLVGQAEVGLYSLAVRLTEVWTFVPMVVSSSFFPSIVNAKEASQEDYYSKLQKLYNFLTWLGIGIAASITASSWMIKLLLGTEYEPVAPILQISIWSIIFIFQGVARGKWLVTENLQRFSYWYIGMGGITNIILNFLWIPYYGGKGAALATLISQAVVAIIAPFCFSSTRISSKMLVKAFIPFK
jgi:PST family polysaccharide transporter